MGTSLAERHHQRLGHRYAPSPAALPTHAPGLAAFTGLVVDVLSMRNPFSRWYLTTHQISLTLVVIAGGAAKRYRKDAGAGGRCADRYGIISGQAVIRKISLAGSIDANALSKSGRLGRIMRGRFVEGLGWRAIR
ncbi:hypothetical protein ACNKHL_09970 [Shigella flexneri]